MYLDDEIKFEKGIPNPESILEEIRNISGINDLIWNDAKTKFIHTDFVKREFFIFSENDSIHLGRGWDDQWYLLDVTLIALINLGGIYDGKVSESGRMKWEEAKMNYPVVSDPKLDEP